MGKETLKKCIDCKKDKILSDYPFDKFRNRFLSVCKSCTSLRTKKYKSQNPDKWVQYSRTHSYKRRNFIDNWKSQGCLKCHDKRFYVIDAHHLNPLEKDFDIGSLCNGIRKVKEELEKCIPLCSNCHREFHYLEKTKKINIDKFLNKQL